MQSAESLRASDITDQLGNDLKPFTVIGLYPSGTAVVVHVACKNDSQARRRAVQHIAFQVYDGQIPDGLDSMNEAIAAVSSDFKLLCILEGHAKPIDAENVIFHSN